MLHLQFMVAYYGFYNPDTKETNVAHIDARC